MFRRPYRIREFILTDTIANCLVCGSWLIDRLKELDLDPDMKLIVNNLIIPICYISYILIIMPLLWKFRWYLERVRPDDRFFAWILSSIENHKYDDLYKILNRSPSPKIYESNFKYNNIYNCYICIDEFCKLWYGNEAILHCGHRYHSNCLRKWELEQFRNNPYAYYKCPMCQKLYDWKQKYQYIYTIKYNLP